MLASAPESGAATHIGHFRIEHTVCLNLATGEMTHGEATVIAANGDAAPIAMRLYRRER